MTDETRSDATDWHEVKELLADALELPARERDAFVRRVAKGKPALAAELQSLLEGAGDDSDYLERSASELLEIPAPELGARLGTYTLRDVIGEGGMGRVYAATQEHPHRTVALKVLRPGLAGPDSERRFRWEIEALGRLSHPGIAAVHDAGVEATGSGPGVWWFAMEKVDGQPLLEAADALRLDRRERLGLFLRVADAVAHAHRRGVIHRDLKPDNILVDDQGQPHVLDFGIARVSDPLSTSVTTTGEIVGTIAYMSPEQLLGSPDKVDARSDVYALGVLLFRLLTGAAPIDVDGLPLPAVARRVTETDPRPAGSLNRALKGDLETILAAALERDVTRRYGTVEGLAADVRAFLADEPIAARPATALYQLTKLARRHKGLMAGATLGLLGLIGATVATGVGIVQAKSARDDAIIERDRARDVNVFLKRFLGSASPDFEGPEIRVVQLLDAAALELEVEAETEGGLAAAVRAGLHLTLGETYRRLGMHDAARDQLESAAEGFARSDGPLAESTLEAHGALAEVYCDLGEIELAEASLELLHEGLAAAEAPPEWLTLRPLEIRGAIAYATGDIETNVAATREVFEAWLAGHGGGDDAVETARNHHANALLRAGRYEEADVLLAEGIRVQTQIFGPNHPKVAIQRGNRARAAVDAGDSLRGLEIAEGLVPIARRIWGPDNSQTLAVDSVRANALQNLGRLEEAQVLYADMVARCQRAFGPLHEETLLARNNSAVLLMNMERHAEAEVILRELLGYFEGDAGVKNPVSILQAEMNLAAALAGQGRSEDAVPVNRRCVELLTELVGEAHPNTVITRNNLAMTLMEIGDAEGAVTQAKLNLDLASGERPDHRMNEFPLRSNLARALSSAGRHAEAVEALLGVHGFLASDPGAQPHETARVEELLGDVYEAWGKPEESAQWRAQR